jgi:hypothetical protein
MPTQKDPTTFGYQNFYSTTLTGDITAGTLTIGLATVPTPTSGILIIEPDFTSSCEVVFYTSKGASTITCPSDGRGWSGTSAASHLTGSTVIMASVDEYFEGLADGTLSTDPLRSSFIPNHIVSGGVIAQSSGLIGTLSTVTFHLSGQRYTSSAIANKTYTASKDTYVDVTGISGGTVTVAYNEVSNGAASPTLAAGYLRLGKVVTSGAAITGIEQVGYDTLGNRYYNTVTVTPQALKFQAAANSWADGADTFWIQAQASKPKDILTLGSRQDIQFRWFLRPAATGNVVLYRVAYTFALNGAQTNIETSGTAATLYSPASYRTIAAVATQLDCTYYAQYDTASLGFRDVVRSELHRDGAGGGDTAAGILDFEKCEMYYNKDYSKSY